MNRFNIKCLFGIFSILVFIIITGCREEQPETARLNLYLDEISKDLGISLGSDILTILHYSPENYKPYFHPVNTVEGIRITRGWPDDPFPLEPVDHPHQKGLWFNFGDVNGFDFWNNSDSIREKDKKNYGRIINDSVSVISVTEDTASFVLYNRWISETDIHLLNETAAFTIRVKTDYWILERLTKLEAACPLTFGDNKEGLFAIRMAREFQCDYGKKELILDTELRPGKEKLISDYGKSGYYSSSSGKNGKDAWGTANEWICLDGIVDADSVSVMIMDDPSNFAHPPRWHARDYGLFSVNNFGLSSFEPGQEPLSLSLGEEESIVLRHTVVVKSGGFLSQEEKVSIYELFRNSP